jgi:hypothetical protein
MGRADLPLVGVIFYTKPELLSAETARKFRPQSKDFNALSYHTGYGVSSALLLKIFIQLKIWQTIPFDQG